MRDTSDGGNQHGRGLRGDPVADSGQNDGTRDEKCTTCNDLHVEVAQLRQERDEARDKATRTVDAFVRRLDAEVERCKALEAARDHLRARLQQYIAFWQAEAARINNYHATMGIGWTTCAADLLAILTEPPQQQNDEKTNENDTRSAETDVT